MLRCGAKLKGEKGWEAQMHMQPENLVSKRDDITPKNLIKKVKGRNHFWYHFPQGETPGYKMMKKNVRQHRIKTGTLWEVHQSLELLQTTVPYFMEVYEQNHLLDPIDR